MSAPCLTNLRFNLNAVEALDIDGSGMLTAHDLAVAKERLKLKGEREDGKSFELCVDDSNLGIAARIFQLGKRYRKYMGDASDPSFRVTKDVLAESAAERTLKACDSYRSNARSTNPEHVLDLLLAHPDTKMNVFKGGIAGRSYPVVHNGRLESRTAEYDGKKIYLYVPAAEREAIAALNKRIDGDPKYSHIEIVPIEEAAFSDPKQVDQLKFDKPGIFWVSHHCPVLPNIQDNAGYVVPGGRFGIELYYHDARINIPGARSTVESLMSRGDADARKDAEVIMSLMRGTVNALVHQVNHYGKIFNMTTTPSLGRSQAPCLTSVAREVYSTWTKLFPEELDSANKWLRWAADAAKKEYETVWMSPPRLDAKTGLSSYLDEHPSAAPEEDPEFYAGMEWGAEDLASDGAVRELGWDSMAAALANHGEHKGRPRAHRLIPVCLNSLLFKYEKDLAAIASQLDGPDSADAKKWEAAAKRRKDTMNRLMWNPERGLYIDLYKEQGSKDAIQNGHEDLRSFTPLWVGIVEPGSPQARALHRRVRDFVRPGGLSTATAESWEQLHAMNSGYVDHCQWGHKDIGWPIATYETVVGLKKTGAEALGDEIAYRWCHMVQEEMDNTGGLRHSQLGDYEGPVMEKMDVSHCSAGGSAGVGYGNQGSGLNGEAAGFRWGLDAYKLLFRQLPPHLADALKRNVDPELMFNQQMLLARRGR